MNCQCNQDVSFGDIESWYIPPQGRTTVLQELHGGHPGITRMKSLARGLIWWPKLDEEIETMLHSCSICQTQSDNPPVAPLYGNGQADLGTGCI